MRMPFPNPLLYCSPFLLGLEILSIGNLLGGNHFRIWQQQSSEAFFFATSVEEWLGEKHNIAPNGYELREQTELAQLVRDRTRSTGPKRHWLNRVPNGEV